MVFPSVPVYLDPPNWHQQFHLPPVQPTGLIPTISNPSNENHPSSQISSLAQAGQPGTVRPGSMADRARLAKIPQPEVALKCPRCESTNTKFCYFNNYSLSQPRHFCKTCRRYWTRGGALRNVPVGGGCRRNKKSKNSNGGSKSCTAAASAADKQSGGAPNGCCVVPDIPGHHNMMAQPHTTLNSHLSSLVATLQSLSGYGNIGVNLGGVHGPVNIGDGTNLHQFPVLENNLLANPAMASRVPDQFYGVKMEENVLKRPFLGFVADQNNNSCGQFWGGSNNCWTDLSGLNNPSAAGTATNLL